MQTLQISSMIVIEANKVINNWLKLKINERLVHLLRDGVITLTRTKNTNSKYQMRHSNY